MNITSKLKFDQNCNVAYSIVFNKKYKTNKLNLNLN